MNQQRLTGLKPLKVIETQYSFSLSENHETKDMQLRIFSHEHPGGSLNISPLFSKSNPKNKQAVLFSKLSFTDLVMMKTLMKEALMLSWEMDYKVAFTSNDFEVYSRVGFQKVQIPLILAGSSSPVYYFDLAWDGIKKLPSDIVFPQKINP